MYAPPQELGDPPPWSSKHTVEGILEDHRAWEIKVVAWAKQHGNGPYAGEIIQFPVADGRASYIVLSLKPVQLIHLSTGDDYEYPYIERLTATDITQRIEQTRKVHDDD